jgi:hypothetical protein
MGKTAGEATDRNKCTLQARPRRVNIYVDGFNLYYGCCKATPYKWLDLAALAAQLLPG